MDATDKMAERVLEWFRKYAPEDGVRLFDDNDGVSIGVDGHIHICKLVAFLMHGDATHTPGPPPELRRNAGTSHPMLWQRGRRVVWNSKIAPSFCPPMVDKILRNWREKR